jgi:sugar lactone lactonase YvrE
MRGFGSLLLCFGLSSSVTGCGGVDKDAVGSHHHVGRTNGGAVALSYDERVAVVTNRSAGIVTVLSLKPERGLKHLVARTTVLPVGADSEPWAAVVGADDDTAYVVLRKTQQVIRIDDLRTNPTVAQDKVRVGSEPMSIAISPSGKVLFVANWSEGTISKIDTEPFIYRASIDLNQRLVDKHLLGDALESRPGLAHPRGLTISDNGDQNDDDEMIYATEFFSQPIPGATRDFAAVDSNREGLVYSTHLGSGQPGPTMEISPVLDTSFPDSNGDPTSCFPNQLYAAAVDGDRLYVTAMCTSPKGPLDKKDGNLANYKTLVHPAVFALDTKMNEELPEQGHLLTRVLQDYYDRDGEVANARMPLIPNDIAFRPGKGGLREAYVLALGADAVFRLDYDASGTLANVGSEHHRFVGPLPEHGYADGLAVTRRSSPAFGLVLSDVTQDLSVIDLASQEALPQRLPMTGDDAQVTALRESPENQGRGLFATGRGVWSLAGQAWSSCESCHPGGLSDGVTWYFARGPRRTLSAANTYEKGAMKGQRPGRRLLLWGANVDEVHDVEGIVRTVSGGSGAVLWQYLPSAATSDDCRIGYDGKSLAAGSGLGLCKQAKATSVLRNGLNGSLAAIVDGNGCAPSDSTCDSSLNEDWNRIDAFIQSLRVPQPPSQLDVTYVNEGRKLFQAGGCANCHGGRQWTVSTLFYDPGDDKNGKAPVLAEGSAPSADLDLALGRLRQDRYYVSDTYAALNPPAANSTMACPAGSHCTTYRVPPGDGTDAALKLLYGIADPASKDARGDAAKAAGGDQLRCALRNVGTFPVLPEDLTNFDYHGIAPQGQPSPQEYRHDRSLAQGKDGFSVPSLFGLAVGAPYFHAGNARTLEEVFDENFRQHHNNAVLGLSDSFLSGKNDVQYLIAFLLSLDETSPPEDVPSGMNFCTNAVPPGG